MEAVADDRMAGRGIRRIYKSRYDAISCYIYSCKGRPVRRGFLHDEGNTRLCLRVSSYQSAVWLCIFDMSPQSADEVLNKYNDAPVEVDEGLLKLLKDR